MTAPGDGLEEALRRGLAEAVGRIEPAADGLERIRARIGDRPPRPWLLTVGADALGAARNWVWRGHSSWQLSWKWPTVLPAAAGGVLPRVPPGIGLVSSVGMAPNSGLIADGRMR